MVINTSAQDVKEDLMQLISTFVLHFLLDILVIVKSAQDKKQEKDI